MGTSDLEPRQPEVGVTGTPAVGGAPSSLGAPGVSTEFNHRAPSRRPTELLSVGTRRVASGMFWKGRGARGP